jgi:hypothetical protein
MSAERLREAAGVLRRDWPVVDLCPDRCLCNKAAAEHGERYHPEAEFHRAVADWLDAEAEHLSSHDCEAHCEPDGCDRSHKAIAVADLILGGAS